ncbi:MAG TPA: cytochrome P450 [Acidimicrobiia bacterium]|nr:cytochrome P450 [Acidimicrobiia bacterium]
MNASSLVDQFEWLLSGEEGDVYSVYRRLRAETPLLWSPAITAWVVSRHVDVRRVLESDEFEPLTEGFGTPMIYGRTVLAMTGEEHRKKTALIARRIRNLRRLEEQLQPLIREWCRGMVAELPDSPEAFDLKSSYFTPLPLRVIAHLMGVEGAEKFREWYAAIVAGGMSNMRGDQAVKERAVAARESLFDFLRPRLEQMTLTPEDDLLSDLTTMEYEGARMTIDEILAFSAFLLVAGIETTERTMTNLATTLAGRPDLWIRLRDDRSLVQPAIAEALRLTPPIHALTRKVARELELHETRIAPGDRIVALIASANLDEAVFPHPEEFDLDRFRDNPRRQFTPKSDLISFGAGEHHCTGSLLALVEMTEAFDALLDSYESISLGSAEPPAAVGYILRSPRELSVFGSRGTR